MIASDMRIQGHAVVCGFGHLGQRIAQQLGERGYDVLVIDVNGTEAIRQRIQASGCRFIDGDIREESVLDLADIENAACFLSVTGDDCANLQAAISARQRSDRTLVVTRLYDESLARRLDGVFHIHALSASYLASPAYVAAATDDSIVAMFNVDECHLSIYRGCTDGVGAVGRHRVFVGRSPSGLCLGDQGKAASQGDSCLTVAMHSEGRHRRERSRKHRSRWRALVHRARTGLSLIHPRHLLGAVVDLWRNAALISRAVLLSLLTMVRRSRMY